MLIKFCDAYDLTRSLCEPITVNEVHTECSVSYTVNIIPNHAGHNLFCENLVDIMAVHIMTTVVTSGLFYYHGLTLIPAWISNHMLSKVWDEITYLFLNFNSAAVEI